MAHLSPDRFVDIVDGVLAEADVPHLAACAECTRQLADLRAMMAEMAHDDVPEPLPLFFDQLSERVRVAVADESARRRSWRERLWHPWILVPSCAGALAVALLAVLLPRPALAPAPPAPPPSTQVATAAPGLSATGGASLPSMEPSLPPLGAADDPQLGLVADYGTTLEWDDMRDEMALGLPAASSDALVGALTADEQRELQRLLADEMAQPGVPENRS
jgi:hypothetical protein